MPHVLETIEDGLVTVIAGTPTVGANVYRWRARPMPKGVLAANVRNVADNLAEISGSDAELRVADFEIDTVTPASSPALALEAARDALAEITAAVHATDLPLGIAGVLRAWLDNVQLEVESDGERNVATCTQAWQVQYQIAAGTPTAFIT